MVKEKTNKKTIGVSTLITIGLVMASMIGPGFFEDTNYYCEAESSIKKCPGNLSGGQGTRCYFNEEHDSWDYCRSGWLEVTDDFKIQEEPVTINSNVTGTLYKCDSSGCVEI